MFFFVNGVNLALNFEYKSMYKISLALMLFVGLFLGNETANAQAIVASPSPIPTSICNGDTILFVADNSTGTLSYFGWNFNGAAAGPQTVLGQNVTFVAGNVGTFTFDLIVSDGMVLDTFSFSMTINPCNPPTISISGTPTTVCEGTTVNFTDATIPGSVPITGRQWIFPGGIPATSTSVNPIVTYAAVGTYSVYYVVTDANGSYGDTLINYIDVVSCPAPIAAFTASSTQLCPGNCISFLDQSQNLVIGQSTWSWSFPGSDSAVSTQQNPQNICYPIPGVYDVMLTVTNANGQDSEVKVGYILVDSCTVPTAGYTVETTKICQGTCVQFFNNSTRDDSVSWTFFGANPLYQTSSESNPIVCYDDTGTFDVQLVAFNNYGPSTPILDVDIISVKPFPTIQAPPDTSVLIGNKVKLIAFGDGIGFKWSPSEDVECPFCGQTFVSPTENTQYFVTAFNENGCESRDSVNVVVIQQFYRGVPDAFTPNGDEQNDVVKVFGNGIKTLEFFIYDRHGSLVFESNDQSIGWDGTLDGEAMEAGVYAYFAKITYESGYQEILKGNVTLVR